ncbi:MAG: TonB-dependent receptor [Planctomycetes bacterium]|nr:TonB-dependent receptor [Planctomycetota bacterium]
MLSTLLLISSLSSFSGNVNDSMIVHKKLAPKRKAITESPTRLSKSEVKPLDLERIIIKGQARRSALPGTKKEVESPTALKLSKEKPIQLNKEYDPQITWNDTLRISGGSFKSWGAQNKLRINRNHADFGLLFGMAGSNGFREGYGRKDLDVGFEYNQRSLKHMNVRFISRVEQRKLELAEPIQFSYRGFERKESIIINSLNLTNQLTGDRKINIFIDHESTAMNDTHRDRFSSTMLRAGYIFEHKPWSTAVSLEKDKRGESSTILARVFTKHSKRIVAEGTYLHLGLGGYIMSNKSKSLYNNGYLSLTENDNKLGAALSPYIQLDHRINSTLTAYASYTQFYESLPLRETFYDAVEMSGATEQIQPSFNMQLEGGLKLTLSNYLKGSLNYRFNNYRNRYVMVEDYTVENYKLTLEPWRKGRQTTFLGKVQAKLSKRAHINASFQYLDSFWYNENISFTPYQPRHISHLSLEYFIRNWIFELGGEIKSKRVSYPEPTKLPDHYNLTSRIIWNANEQLKLSAQAENLLKRDNIITQGYPDEPFRFSLNLHFTL